nr:retrovirus-related Pol polyprotein from transposon TNT 1-94 [Tanacetum cinerariifolium]
MADNRTMAQMLQTPIEGYEDAIVVTPINANNFELKQTLINLEKQESGLIKNLRKLLSSTKHKPELRHTKDFEAKYNKVKAELAFLGSSASAPKSSMVKKKGSHGTANYNVAVSKEGTRNGEWVKISVRKDTRSSQEYIDDIEEEYQARALLAKSKRFFKKGTQSSTKHKPELRHTKDFEAKYNKVKAELAFLGSSASAPKSSMVKKKGLIAEAYEWDEEEVSSDDNEMVKVQVLMALLIIMLLSAKKHAVATASVQYCFEKTNHESIVLIASMRYQININDVSFIEPYKSPEPVVLKAKVPTDQNSQADQNNQNDHLVQTNEILHDDQSEHTYHNNDYPIIDNLTNTLDVYNPKPNSTLVEDTLVPYTIPISIVPSSSIPSIVSSVPQDRWSQDKHIKMVNIIGDPGTGMLIRAMVKELSAASAHECLFVDFLSE